MLKHIMPLVPAHNTYVEPFCGGCAVFWAKEAVPAKILNDYNGMVVNFYQQLKTNFDDLKVKIDATPYSREVYKAAMFMYNRPYIHSNVHKAWAWGVCCIQGFSNKIGSWQGSNTRHKEALLNFNKKEAFTLELADRLKITQYTIISFLY